MLYYFASNIKSNIINMHMDGLKNIIKVTYYIHAKINVINIH